MKLDKVYEGMITAAVTDHLKAYKAAPEPEPVDVDGIPVVMLNPVNRVVGNIGQIDSYDDLEIFKLLLDDFLRLATEKRAAITRPPNHENSYCLEKPFPIAYVIEVTMRMIHLVDEELALSR